MPDAAEEPVPSLAIPKAFISYSWTTAQHQDRVRQWAERLMTDGIDVILDVFDLKEGHDKYSFMERMITDSAVTHVLIISDQKYTEKADSKAAGVGTESQIISSEVYGKVDQSKFIPIVCEFGLDRQPYLPIYMRSRIWLDFSSDESVNQNWERLVRLLHGKPAFRKPQLGKPPAYLDADTTAPISPLTSKLASVKQALVNGSKSSRPARTDFLANCIEFAEAFRLKSDPQMDNEQLAKKIVSDSNELRTLRNAIIDWVLAETTQAEEENFKDDLFEFLEQLLEVKSRPVNMNRWGTAWFDAPALFVYETFLYIVAALLKNRRFLLLHEVLSGSYIRPLSDRSSMRPFENAGAFYAHSEILQIALATGNRRFLSPAAELIKRQADRNDLAFGRIVEAELLVFLFSITTGALRWWPQTLHYASQSDFTFFVRAAQHRHFLNLATVIGIKDVEELKRKAKEGYEGSGISRSSDFFMSGSTPWAQLNVDAFDSI